MNNVSEYINKQMTWELEVNCWFLDTFASNMGELNYAVGTIKYQLVKGLQFLVWFTFIQ